MKDTLVFIFCIAAAEKEVLRAKFGAEMASGKEKATSNTGMLKTDGAFIKDLHILGSRTIVTVHKPQVVIILQCLEPLHLIDGILFLQWLVGG